MLEKLNYKLPKNKDKICEALRVIPSNWSFVDGWLIATRELYENNKIAENTRLYISRYYPKKPLIIDADDIPFEIRTMAGREIRKFKPKINDVFLRGKMFSSIHFDKAGFGTEEIIIEDVKELAEGFIMLGYKGWIKAYNYWYSTLTKSDSKIERSSEKIYFMNINEIPSQMSPCTPHISIEWSKENKREPYIKEVIENFEKLRLKQIQF